MNKKNLYLGAVLVILIGLAFLYSGPFQNWKNNLGKSDNFLSGIDFTQANNISIANNGNSFDFEKVGDRWLIAPTKDFYLSDEQVQQMESAIALAKEAEMEKVSENPDKKDDFKTSEEEGTKVIYKQGDEVVGEFIIGSSGPDFNSTYISRSDMDGTYLVKANLRPAFVRSDWYDKTVFDSGKDQINKIRFQYPTREFTIEKNEDGEWSGTLPYEFSVDQEKAGQILDVMSGLTAVDIPEQTFDGTGLEKNQIIVQASGEGIDNIIMVGDKLQDEDRNEDDGYGLYFAKRGNSDNIYLISQEDRDNLDWTIQSLR